MKLHIVTPPAADKKFVGDEPIWHDGDISEKNYLKQMIRGLNWHNYCAKETDFRKYFVEWTKEHAPQYVSVAQDLDIKIIDKTLAATARMHMQGFPIKKHHEEQIIAFLESQKSTPRSAPEPTKTIPVIEKVKKQVSEVLQNIDAVVQKAKETGKCDADNLRGIIFDSNYKTVHLKLIANHFTKHIDALKGLSDKKTQAITAVLVPLRVEIVAKADSIATRKKKVITAAAKVRSLSLVKTLGNHVGVDAKEIIGATRIWVYDTKTRSLGYMRGTQKGLSVKGKTVTGVVASQKKILRWPNDQLKEFMKTKKVNDDWIESLTTHWSELTPRLKDTMILLRVE